MALRVGLVGFAVFFPRLPWNTQASTDVYVCVCSKRRAEPQDRQSVITAQEFFAYAKSYLQPHDIIENYFEHLSLNV